MSAIETPVQTQAYVDARAKALFAKLEGDERATLTYQGESSDFVRFNGARVRQAGSVEQHTVRVRLVNDRRGADVQLPLGMEASVDDAQLAATLRDLRETLRHVPEDPYCVFAEDQPSGAKSTAGASLPASSDILDRITAYAGSGDLVGIHASGPVRSGFFSSLGQSNWFRADSFHLDWSLHRSGDKAVKTSYAGTAWDDQTFADKLARAEQQLAVLDRTPKKISPGAYRALLDPAAVVEVLDTLAWGGFGLKAQRTKQTPLLRLVEGASRLDDRFVLSEDAAGGVAPRFQADGFARPDRVPLVADGKVAGQLVSPRSAIEYGVETNGASPYERPESLKLEAGTLPRAKALEALGEGIAIGNLWYLNFSDRAACRATGMTRFATFWVEGGEIVAPLSVMRFDESLYRLFGSNLVDLTEEVDMVLDGNTYSSRSTTSYRVPGMLVEDFAFTL